MNLSGIRTSSVFYDYNQIKNEQLQNQRLQGQQTIQDSDEQKKEVAAAALKSDHGAENFAKRYQPDATYELKGTDSDISSLDVEKFMTDLKKDQVLQLYQFFVGDSLEQSGIWQNRTDENFSL